MLRRSILLLASRRIIRPWFLLCIMISHLFKWYWQWLKSLVFVADSAAIIDKQAAAEADSSSPFGRLPDDTVENIFAKLGAGDRARLRLVCKSWRRTLTREDIPAAPEPPWLIFSEDSYSEPDFFLTNDEICFKSYYEERTYRFKLPPPPVACGGGGGGRRRWCCCGSSRGWLLMGSGEEDVRKTEMFLWNPINGAIRKLPPLSSLPFFNQFVDDAYASSRIVSISRFISRVQVSFDSINGGGSVVVVAVLFVNPTEWESPQQHDPTRCSPQDDSWQVLVMCTPQDQSWSICGGWEKQFRYRDILFRGGKLYASCRSESADDDSNIDINTYGGGMIRKLASYTIHLMGCDVEVDMLRLIYKGAVIGDEDNVEEDQLHQLTNVRQRWQVVEHLVESSTTGELLVVSTILDLCAFVQGPDDSLLYYTQARGFEVRRLVGNLLEKMTNIGEQCIFLGAMGSSLSFSSIHNGVEADCIYFTIDDADGQKIEPSVKGYEHNIVGEHDDGDILNNEDYDFFDAVYRRREQGVFYVQHNRIRKTRVTNIRFHSGSTTGWFTPKLFQK